MTRRVVREDPQAVESIVQIIVAALIICAVVVACSFQRMEQVAKTPQELKREKVQHAAMIQARWEAAAKAKARAEAQP